MKTLTVKPGPLLADEARAWTDAQIPYENRAGNETTDAKAVKIAKEVVTRWSERMGPLWRRWRATLWMLSGNTLDNVGPTDVHNPELYKIIETAVVRIEEAILERDPSFRVVGRRKLSEHTADVLAAYLDWQLDQSDVRSLVQPALRDMLVCQVAAWKIMWDRRIKRRLRRTYKAREPEANGDIKYDVSSEWVNEVDYDGPSARPVDPFDFIMDPQSTDPQTASYVGDRRLMTLDEILRYGELFGWSNLGAVKEAKQGKTLSPDHAHFCKWVRDPTSKYGVDNSQEKNTNRPPLYEVVSLWLRSDIFSDGDYQEIELVIVNGDICCLARQNITDKQIRPFAIARASKSGHELYSVGPMDNAVRLNQQLDRLTSIAYRSGELGAMPIGFAENDSELPDNVYKLRPGTILKDVGKITFAPISDGVTRTLPMLIGMVKSDIEETTGVYKIQMGQEASADTATQSTLAMQEGNRRMRAWARAFADQLKQALRIFHQLNQQFTIQKTPFRVIGKRAVILQREYLEIGPDTLLHDVDFEFVGMSALSNYGLKVTGMTTFVNAFAPFIQANPDKVNQLRMLHSAARELIGPSEADEYVAIPSDTSKLVPQAQENLALLQGAEIEIHEEDDDISHIKEMEPLYRLALDEDSDLPEAVRLNIIGHRVAHGFAAEKKAAQQKAMQNRQQAIAMATPVQAGTAPRPGGFQTPQGRPGQRQGENPGPPDQKKTPRTGGETRIQNQSEAPV